MKDENYIVIQGWMRNQLNLKANELLIYALIYGFCQDASSHFTGSQQYMCNAVGCTRPTLRKALDSLIQKKLLQQYTHNKNGVIFNEYKTLQAVKKLYMAGKETLHEGGKETLHGGGKETLHNNTINNNTINNNTNIRQSASLFVQQETQDSTAEKQIKYPFEDEVFFVNWQHWKLFKKKEFKFNYKSVQSEQAALKNLATLSSGDLHTAIAIIQQSMANGWKGFFQLKKEQNGKQEFTNKLHKHFQEHYPNYNNL